MGNIKVSSLLTWSASALLHDCSLSASAMAILSRLKIEQLSIFLGTELLILNNICHSISDNSILFEVVNLARAVDCNFLRMLCLCCCHLVLKEVLVESIYSLSLTFTLYTPFKRHSPLNGQFILFLQLQVLFVLFSASKIFFLCELMIFLILGKQLYEILIVVLLKILWNFLFLGKWRQTRYKNFLPILLFKELQNGGLKYMIFLNLLFFLLLKFKLFLS